VKQIAKRSISIVLVLMLLVSLLPGITLTSSAASYVYNWGERGEEVTEFSNYATAWYAKYNTSYEELSALSGASSTSSVPNSALYAALQSLMKNAHSYENSYEACKTLAAYTDCQNGGGKISTFYAGNPVGPTWDGSWNREHTWPNSKGLNGNDENDIMMIRPDQTSTNSSRGNKAYGKSSGFYHPNEVSDTDNNYDNIVNGEYDLRGDCARIFLYVYVRWGNVNGNGEYATWGSNGVIESKEVLLEWMEADPVDTWELGRNDAVQSITGTRNVFVDYPELAFDLFNEPVPDMDTPSDSGASYSITATSSNTTYGTVSVSGKTITASPKAGYYASGYKVTSGTATVTQNGNEFTVAASSNCTVQIIFSAKTTVTVTFSGANAASQTGYAGESMSLPTVTAPEGYTFLGWTAQPVNDTTQKPSYYTDSFIPAATTTLYALYRYTEGGSGVTEYVLTDITQISATDEVVITMSKNGTIYALSSTNGSSDGPSNKVTVTASENKLTSAPSADMLWNMTGSENSYSFNAIGTTNYLYTTNDNDGVRVGTNANKTFRVITDTKGTYLYNNETSRYVGVYTGGSDWRCYTSINNNITGQTLGFYVKGESGTIWYTTNASTCDHSDTTNVAETPATCTESGYTAGVYCNDCESYISGHTVIEALGHSYNSGVVTTQPTCTATGVKTFTCIRCDDSYTESVAANGHSYESVVTPPTVTQQGYTTYTCTVCGDSYKDDYVEALGETYIVSFSVPEGVSAVANMECGKSGITLPSADVPTGEHTYRFVGWTTEAVQDAETAPAIYKAGATYTATENTTLYALYTYVVSEDGSASDGFTLYSGALTEGDYIIVYSGGAMVAADADSSGRLDYTDVTISNDTVEDPADTVIWHIAPDGNYWTIYNEANGVYAAGTGTKNKATVITSVTDYARWTASGDSTYEFKNLGNTNKGVNSMLRKNGTYGFACYSSSTGGALTLYKGSTGTTYYTTMTPEASPVTGWNITLSDSIGVNFVINGEDALFFLNGEPVEAVYSDGKYTVTLAAAQMTDEISIEINGMELADTYSVREYADILLSDSAQSDCHDIVKYMLAYGAASQAYFNYNTGNLADEGIDAEPIDPTEDESVELSGMVEGVAFYGASLLHKDAIAVRFYFEVDSLAGLTFKVGDGEYAPQQKDGKYYIDVTGINPQDIGTKLAVTVSDGTDEISVRYAPLDYILRMYMKADTGSALEELMLALYSYYFAASVYTA